MITALSSGGLGDIVYSIPIMRELHVEKIYVKENYFAAAYGNMYMAIRSLLSSQGFEVAPYPSVPMFEYVPGIKIDFDLDTFREQRNRGITHIMKSLRNQFNLPIKESWKDPWLFGIEPTTNLQAPYTVIHLTDRWRGGKVVNWKEVVHSIGNKIYFIGLQHEWVEFCTRYSNVTWWPVDDILDMARVIAGGENIYCNQSVSLAIAQGLGNKKYFLERKPGKTNTLLFTKNEKLL